MPCCAELGPTVTWHCQFTKQLLSNICILSLKAAAGNDSESGLKTQSDTEMRSETDPDNTQTGSQTDSGHPDSLSHTSSKHSHSSDHVQDEVTSTIRGTATSICVQSAPPLQWSEVIALGYIPEDWLPPKLPRREQIVESQCSRLQLLHHAFHCSESQETCHIGRGCLATKHLWQHILACDSVNCDPRYARHHFPCLAEHIPHATRGLYLAVNMFHLACWTCFTWQ